MYIQQQKLKSSKYCEKINVDETHAYDFLKEGKIIQLSTKCAAGNNESISFFYIVLH